MTPASSTMTKWAMWMAFRPELARRALRQTAQGKFTHGKGCRERVALDAGTGAGQQDCAAAMRYHSPCRLLNDEKPAKGRYFDRLAHGFRVELGDRAVGASAGVVEHGVGLPEPPISLVEQARDGSGVRRINGECLRAGLGGERRQFFDIACRQ